MPPADFALSIGECLYHQRSVLDHLVWALVKGNHQTPGKHNEFPIMLTAYSHPKRESDSDAFCRIMQKTEPRPEKLVGVHPDAVALIERAQPYNRMSKPRYYVALVHKLAQQDRHHALPTSQVIMGEPEALKIKLILPRGVRIIDEETLFKAGDSLKVGTNSTGIASPPGAWSPRCTWNPRSPRP